MTNLLSSRLSRVLLALQIAWAWPVCAAEQPHRVAGVIEQVLVGRAGAQFEAKLDTGADLSSIDATEVTHTWNEGQRWVEFSVLRPDGSRVRLSGPLVRHTRIKRGGAGHVRRPVVELELCLGPVARTVEVSLANREGLEYDVLVGTNFMRGYFMVDPARMHVLTPKCAVEAAK